MKNIKYFLHNHVEISREEIEEYFNEDFDDNFEIGDYFNLSKDIIKEIKNQKYDYETTFPSDYLKKTYPKEYDKALLGYICVTAGEYTYLKMQDQTGNIEYRFFQYK